MNHIANAAQKLPAYTPRTLHIKVYPTPRTFAERREVLRVLERFGEVTMFKSHKYDPSHAIHNAFITTFHSPSSLSDVLNASPLRYRLISTSPTKTPNSPPEQIETPFSLHASPTTFSHTLYLSSPTRNPLHGPFHSIPPSSSFIAASLSPLIPDSNFSAGLKDWETERKMRRNEDIVVPGAEVLFDDKGKVVGEEEQKRGWERKRDLRGVARVMGGLRGLWEEGERRKVRDEVKEKDEEQDGEKVAT